MSDDSTTQCLLFPGIFRKPVVAQFDQREGSCDGGALLLKAADRHYELVAGLSSCLRDERQSGKVDHSLRELVAQRVFSIACGYPDANDSARLSGDPIHKLLLDRDPVEGRDLASQPTLSRFENGVGVKELYRSGEFLAESVIRRHAKRVRRRAYRVTIDLDPTDDPTHGAQQLSFFNGHYDSWCYLPVMGFVSFNDEAEQYLCAAVLRPGNVTAAVGAVGLLRRLVRMIRHHFPGVRIRVRLDGGFAHPAVLKFLDAQPRLEYVVAMAKNAVLKRIVETGMRRARRLSRRSGKTEHIYGEVCYAARKWPCQRRVIIKAEVVRAADKDPRDNPRFVITNMKRRSVQPNIPVTYSQERYVFDFRSCWGTWVTKRTGGSFIELNIGGDVLRCNVTYIPSTRSDRPGGSEGIYLCQIPYEVGVRAFESVDLRSKLPRLGLPQFCREDEPNSFQSAMAIAFWSNVKFPTSAQFEWVETANMVDVQCAAIASSKLTMRLNAYAEKLVLDHIDGHGFKVEACGGKYTLSPAATSVDSQNRTLFPRGPEQ